MDFRILSPDGIFTRLGRPGDRFSAPLQYKEWSVRISLKSRLTHLVWYWAVFLYECFAVLGSRLLWTKQVITTWNWTCRIDCPILSEEVIMCLFLWLLGESSTSFLPRFHTDELVMMALHSCEHHARRNIWQESSLLLHRPQILVCPNASSCSLAIQPIAEY